MKTKYTLLTINLTITSDSTSTSLEKTKNNVRVRKPETAQLLPNPSVLWRKISRLRVKGICDISSLIRTTRTGNYNISLTPQEPYFQGKIC